MLSFILPHGVVNVSTLFRLSVFLGFSVGSTIYIPLTASSVRRMGIHCPVQWSTRGTHVACLICGKRRCNQVADPSYKIYQKWPKNAIFGTIWMSKMSMEGVICIVTNLGCEPTRWGTMY